MGFLLENWAEIAGIVGGLITLLGLVAELTPFDWDNKAITVVREMWAKIPMFSRDARLMGREKKE